MAHIGVRRNFLLPAITPVVAKERLTRLLKEGRALPKAIKELDYQTWVNQCVEALRDTFGANAPYIRQYQLAGDSPISRTASPALAEAHYRRSVNEKIEVLDKLVSVVVESMVNSQLAEESVAAMLPKKAPAQPKKKGPIKNADVFIVHGHDEAAKAKVARLIQKLGHNPVILHEMTDQGQAIIDKLIKHASLAAFAVVLFTPDDVGATKVDAVNLKPRARQNVVFELGLFVGLIGKDKVCPLYVRGVEMMSDFAGVGYTLMDDSGDGWTLKLAREMKAAGLAVDLNDL